MRDSNDNKAMAPQPVKAVRDIKHWWMLSANPVMRYLLAGVGAAATFHVCVGLMMLAFHVSGSDENTWKSGALVMLQLVAALPWSFVVVSNSESAPLIMVGCIAGTLVNGAIIGAMFGYFARAHK